MTCPHMEYAARGGALLLEHLPGRGNYPEGVLFIIFSNGEAIIYPLEPFDGSYDAHSNLRATLISSDSSTFTRSSDRSDAINFHVHDVELEDSDFILVHRFSFLRSSSGFHPPRKILLSPNRRLLLLFGIQYRSQSCLVVYQILDTGRLKEIFFDLTISFVDVCFSPDSNGLLAVPRHNPYLVLLLRLPIITDERHIIGLTLRASPSLLQIPKSQTISFEPRPVGPLCVFGPTVNIFGEPLEITHIEANEYYKDDELDEEDEEEDDDDCGFHFLTWNDGDIGDYCLWHISSQNNEYIFHCFPRLISNVYDQSWLESTDTPKTKILQARFHQYNLLCFLIQREGFAKTNANGIGLQMVQLPEEFVDTRLELNTDGSLSLPQVKLQSYSNWIKEEKPPHPSTYPSSCWYKVAEESCDTSQILTMKWTSPLMLGTMPSVAVIIKGVGLFEMVDHCFASKFQDNGKIEDFSKNASNFCQFLKNYRFWTTNDGSLRVLVVTPKTLPTYTIEWADFVDKKSPDYWAMKMFGNKFGYFINDLKEDPDQAGSYLESTYNNWKKTSKKDSNSKEGAVLLSAAGRVLGYKGMHLYRCWQCRRVLLKPLQCSKCKSVAYCSELCQQKHWMNHRQVCTNRGLFYPHKFMK